MGFKAMIHTLAAKARGFPVTSIGSLLDEPFTGVVYLRDSGITTDFRSLKGKKIGYVGEFGKVCEGLASGWGEAYHSYSQIQIDELTKYYGMKPTDYEAVRCGMNVSKAIIEGSIHAGIGLEVNNAPSLWIRDGSFIADLKRMFKWSSSRNGLQGKIDHARMYKC
jgi:pyrimidine precursor biosynthesis enzyme